MDPSASLQDERDAWNDYGATLPMPPDVSSQETTINGIPSLILTPPNPCEAIILYAHGGGLTTGSLLTHRSYAAALSTATRCKLILFDYRLLPEHPISAPRDDLLTVYNALLTDWEATRIIFAGDSSGGAITVSALCHLRSLRKPLPVGNVVISGAFDATLSNASHRTNAAVDPLLSPEVLKHWQTQLGPDVALRDPVLSPIFADLTGLPPHLLLAGDDELWRDDTLDLADQIASAGGDCETQIFEGMWHVWPMTPDIPETTQAFQMIASFIAKHTGSRRINTR
ncbi:MAG: alpha/beta hydrolase [Pseudomonadota bacterium]